MRIVDLIDKKKHGEVLSKDEINFLINSLMDETAPDYQLSAWLMAVYFKGLNEEETAYLTANYTTAKNKGMESYDLFIEKGMSMLTSLFFYKKYGKFIPSMQKPDIQISKCVCPSKGICRCW